MKNSVYRQAGIKFILFTLLLSSVLLNSRITHAQLPENEYRTAATYKNFKILEEYLQRGNTVRVIEYTEGNIKITETIILPGDRTQKGLDKPLPAALLSTSASIIPATAVAVKTTSATLNNNPDNNGDSVILVINKSKYNLNVYYKKNIVRSYKAVFGPQPMMNKCMEGDRCTPEGWFRITDKHVSSKYNKFLGINYPNDSAIVRFNQMKESGKLPKNARMGGNVGIHGIWNGGDNMIELGVGWTDGCIALKNKDVEELFSFVKVGTRVFITK